MATWIGVIVEGASAEQLVPYANALGIEFEVPSDGPFLIHVAPRFSLLHPPKFAEAMSKKLDCTVVAFFVQTAASVESIEHWERGDLKRELTYSADDGGWLVQKGEAQSWEAAYFFAEDEGTGDGQKWPLNLDDELSDSDLERYNTARNTRDASPVMDLLHAGSVWGVYRLCQLYGVNPDKPHGTLHPPKSKAPLVILLIIALFFALMLAMSFAID